MKKLEGIIGILMILIFMIGIFVLSGKGNVLEAFISLLSIIGIFIFILTALYLITIGFFK